MPLRASTLGLGRGPGGCGTAHISRLPGFLKSRLGRDPVRGVGGVSLFEVVKDEEKIGMGFDA